MLVASSSSRESKMKTFGHMCIVESSPCRIRQGLVGLLNPDKPFGVLFDPTRGRDIRVVLSGELLVGLLDVEQGSGFGYAKEFVEAQAGRGTLFRH